MSAHSNFEAVEKDKEAKKQQVIDFIKSKCNADSPFEDLRDIGAALEGGDDLELKILTGGIANYSYKISTTKQKKNLYAKLAFSHNVQFPELAFPVTRTENEFQMMKTFQAVLPGSVVTPYYCEAIDEDTVVLVTEWSKADEQFGNQFIDGSVDIRTVKTLVGGLSGLHSKKVEDPSFNSEMMPFIKSMNPIMAAIMHGFFAHEAPVDRVSALGIEVTKPKLDEAMKKYNTRDDPENKECLIHGDFHVFNILVGSKPSPEKFDCFEQNGDVVVCDFELSMVSLPGRDLGPFQAFPLACVFAHTLNGNESTAHNILTYLETFWNEYAAAMEEQAGKTDTDLAQTYRDALIFCGLWMLGGYGLGIHMEFLPIEEGNDEDLRKVKESFGYVGLKSIMLGVGGEEEPDMSFADLRAMHQSWIENEMNILKGAAKKRPSQKSRRSSILRKLGKQVSDSTIHVPGLDRASFIKMDRAASIAEGPIIDLEGLGLVDDDF